MSELDIKQTLCYSIEEPLAGIEKFHTAAQQQNSHGDWNDEQVDRVDAVDRRLFAVAQRFRRLALQSR